MNTTSDGVERASAAESQAARLRVSMRWLVCGSIVALMALVTWAILAAANGSAAGVVAASSGSGAVAVAWSTGYVAIKTRLDQLTASTDPGQ